MGSSVRRVAASDAWGYAVRNRDAFLINHRDSVVRFGALHGHFEDGWRILGTNRDAAGRSHAGLLTLIPIFERQLVIGFNHLATHQSHMAWLAFRPGLEALLFAGVWGKDPKNAGIWRGWADDRKAFMKAFGGRALRNTEFPAAHELGAVVTEINDRYAHPNPLYTGHGQSVEEGEGYVEISQAFYDDAPTLEAHLLAYLGVLEVCYIASMQFLKSELAITDSPAVPDRAIPRTYEERAEQIREAGFGQILDDLGMWEWSNT